MAGGGGGVGVCWGAWFKGGRSFCFGAGWCGGWGVGWIGRTGVMAVQMPGVGVHIACG